MELCILHKRIVDDGEACRQGHLWHCMVQTYQLNINGQLGIMLTALNLLYKSHKKFSCSVRTSHPKIELRWLNMNDYVIVWGVLYVCAALWVFPQRGSVLFLSKVMPVTMAAPPALNLSLFVFLHFIPFFFFFTPSLSLYFHLLLFCRCCSLCLFFWLTVSAAFITHHSKQATSHHLHGTLGFCPGLLISGKIMLFAEIIEMLHTSP